MIGYQPGAARCVRSLGIMLQMCGQHEEAQVKLEEALSEFNRLGLQAEAPHWAALWAGPKWAYMLVIYIMMTGIYIWWGLIPAYWPGLRRALW